MINILFCPDCEKAAPGLKQEKTEENPVLLYLFTHCRFPLSIKHVELLLAAAVGVRLAPDQPYHEIAILVHHLLPATARDLDTVAVH